ncbi:MAG: hypothetical protein QG664_623 [Patescibacteria group bacterium]|nr:hypothetical protein [Patescibacteria group bacterium]
MNVLQSVQRLIERPGFFTSLDFTRGRTLRFYSLLILIFTAVSVAIALPDAVRFVAAISSQEWRDQTAVVVGLYPDDLEIQITGGTISTNAEEPIVIPFPVSWGARLEQTNVENLLVIDTTKNIALEDFAAKKTFSVLGKNAFGVWDQQEGKVSVHDLASQGGAESFLLTQEKYTQFITWISSILQKILLIGVFLLPVFFYIGYWIGYLIYLLFGAAVVWLVSHLRGYELGYKNAYKAGIYLLPVPLVYDFFVMVLSDFPHARVPFLFTAFLVAMTLRNFPKPGSSDPVPSSATVGEDIASRSTNGNPDEDLSAETGTSKTDKPDA